MAGKQGVVKVVGAIALEAAKELLSQVPLVGALIEGAKKYKEHAEEQQREKFVSALAERVDQIGDRKWYESEDGQVFVKKVVSTALNAEYADKVEFLANALVKGPSLGKQAAMRMKFVEMVRQLSRPALDFLATSERHPADNNVVYSGTIAGILGWGPELADSCLRELSSAGVYSRVGDWHYDRVENRYDPSTYSQTGEVLRTELTKAFAAFISDERTAG